MRQASLVGQEEPGGTPQASATPAPEISGISGTEAQLQALRRVAKLAGDILSHLDLESALLSIVNAALDLFGADIVGILLADEEGDVLRMRACAGHRTIQTARLTVRAGQGVAGKVFETGRPYRVDDYRSDASISRHFIAIAEEDGTRSALGAPMTVRGKVIGTVMVWSRHPSAFSDQDTDTLINLANLATIAIENARLYETERTAVRTLAEAHTKLETQYEHLRRASSVHEELTQLVLRGRGLSDLVEMVAKHTGGKVAILDAGLEILAASPDPDVLVALARRHLRSGRNRPDPARGSPPPFADPASGSWLVTRGVVAGGERLGHLCVALPHPPTGLDPVIVEQAAIVCALELTKERAVSEAQTRVRSDFLWDLLEGSISDDSEALVRARHLGYALPPKVRIMLVPVQGLDEWAGRGGTADAMDRRRESLVRVGERLAGAAGTAQAFAARRGSLIAMVVGGSESSAQAKKLAEAVVGGLSEANPDLAFSAGLSACVALAANLEPAYRQAQHALSAIPVVAASRRVAVFDDLGVLRFLLAPADRGELVGFARRILGPLIDYDQAHGAELVRTVEVFLANDCNLQRAAEQIYVHPKTVRYRLDRAEALSGINLATQQDRFDAHLAVTIIRALALDGSDVS